MNQWPGVHLRVTEGWDEEGHHASDSLHYEGRAVDITTSDRDRSKYGMLARLAVDAGFDWVYYESRAHIHCSVKSESAEAAKYGGCFSDEAVVTTPTKTAVKVSELRVGEQVLAFDPATKKFVFSEVLLFLDRDPLQRRDFVEVTLESGKTLTVTPTHLVVKGTIDFSKSVFAETLVTGDTLLVRNSDNVYRDRVVNVTRVFRTGVYAPLTDVGTIVANDVIVSCYAVVNSHYLAHWVFIPVRLTHNLRDIFYTILHVVSDYTGVVQKQLDYPSRGVHWYPEYIYRFTKNFIPFDIIH